MSVQSKHDSPLADYFDDMGEVADSVADKRHAVLAYIDARDRFAKEFTPYEYMDNESTYGFLSISQVDAASKILDFVEDEQMAISDIGFDMDAAVEDYAYANGYDEPELLIAEMGRDLHRDVWKPLVPMVEAAYELHEEFGAEYQYLNFDEGSRLLYVLGSNSARSSVLTLDEYFGAHSDMNNYVNEELIVDIAMTEHQLDPQKSSADAMFSAEELHALKVVEDFGKGFTREHHKPAFKAHFDELYRDALLGSGGCSATDVMHISSLQDEIRQQSPYEIDTYTMIEQISPDTQRGIPHYLLDALEPVQSVGDNDDPSVRRMHRDALNDDYNLICDFERGTVMMSDIEDQSVRGYILDKQDLIDVIKHAPNNASTRTVFYGEIADKAQASFSTWDVGFSMISDKFIEQGMTHMVYGSTMSDVRHAMKDELSRIEQAQNDGVENARVKTDMSMLNSSSFGELSHEAEV